MNSTTQAQGGELREAVEVFLAAYRKRYMTAMGRVRDSAPMRDEAVKLNEAFRAPPPILSALPERGAVGEGVETGRLSSKAFRDLALKNDHFAVPIRPGVTITWTDEETGEVINRATLKGRNVVRLRDQDDVAALSASPSVEETEEDFGDLCDAVRGILKPAPSPSSPVKGDLVEAPERIKRRTAGKFSTVLIEIHGMADAALSRSEAPAKGVSELTDNEIQAGRALYSAGYHDGFLDGHLIGEGRGDYPDEENQREITRKAESENISDGWDAERDAFLAALRPLGEGGGQLDQGEAS